MGKRGPKFYSAFKKEVLLRFRAVLGRVPEFVHGNENPVTRDDYNNVRKRGWDEVKNVNTNYYQSTLRQSRARDNERVTGKSWQVIKKIERSQPKLLKQLRLVRSSREALETYKAPILSCNDAVTFLRNHTKQRPTAEHAFNVLLKLNIRPDEIWQDDLSGCRPIVDLLVLLRAWVIERKIVQLEPEQALYMNMIAKLGATSADPFARQIEDYVQCIFESLATSSGGVDGFVHQVMGSGGLIAYDDHIAICVVEDGERTLYTWSEVDRLLKEYDEGPESVFERK